ncbi:NINE protein [Ideonella sp.]|uniref:NINE protein n=1 Tax=Ideonella sp. TaxID=1929293 RepID=UPI002B4A4D10|nr:NINE protein [Ideonella sp.]HJV67615.1 NINE protein [Ideonella sp.]
MKSKTLATWLAVLGGGLGVHRLYMRGPRDPWAWAFWPPTLVGLVGVWRMRQLGQDDMLSWALIPLLGLSLSVAMLSAIVIGLTPDERWAARHGAPGEPPVASGWGPVLGVITALMVGGAVLMGTIAFGGQKFFEWEQRQAGADAGR